MTSEIFLTIDEPLGYMSAALKNRGVRDVLDSEIFKIESYFSIRQVNVGRDPLSTKGA
ncbi:MAG: hypothetical protein NNA21_08150 [Nitrospira sp.]|nr:hypothetical protein [Nitrospira sp.]MCP9460607.1 hypothetical protein [Nitrospira sp.]MCP9475125.1 hypothetical protein [Nitrospira sp.]